MTNEVAEPTSLEATADASGRFFWPPALESVRHSRSRTQKLLKRSVDVVGASLGLAVLSPLMLAVAGAIAATDGFPVLYRQKRIGFGMKPFYILKFRSMRKDADEILRRDPELLKRFEVNFKLEDDPRITRIGAFIRKLSLDELPQLYNVLRGEMTLVGPRPIVEKEVALYGKDAWVFCASQPGCTGLWQCSGRSSLSYDARVELDVKYVTTASFWGDLKIILKTVLSVLKRHGAQ